MWDQSRGNRKPHAGHYEERASASPPWLPVDEHFKGLEKTALSTFVKNGGVWINDSFGVSLLVILYITTLLFLFCMTL